MAHHLYALYVGKQLHVEILHYYLAYGRPVGSLHLLAGFPPSNDMQFYKIKNWSKFQHYKERNPPWIKLHFEILSSTDWVMLDNASRVLAIACMLVGSRCEGKIPIDPHYMRRIAYLNTTPKFKPLIDCGFLEIMQADTSMENTETSIEQNQQDKNGGSSVNQIETQDKNKVIKQTLKNNDLFKNLQADARPETETETETESIISPLRVEKSKKEILQEKRGSRLSPNWDIPQEWGEWAEANYHLMEKEINAEADKFKDYWISRADKGAIKKDWFATWRYWIRIYIERKNNVL